MNKYSPEPWRAEGCDETQFLWANNGALIATLNMNPVHNARRILACLKFCRGIETSTLERGDVANIDGEAQFRTANGMPATRCSKCGDWSISDPCVYCRHGVSE